MELPMSTLRRKRLTLLLVGGLCALQAAGCAAGRLPGFLKSGADLAVVAEDECRVLLGEEKNVGAVRAAVERSRRYLERLPGEAPVPLLGEHVRRADVLRVLAVFAEETSERPDTWSDGVCARLRLHRVVVDPPVLTTGYYAPVLPARRDRNAQYRYPVYAAPAEAVSSTREEIDAGALEGKADAIAWLADPIDAFFLQVQGSGVLVFSDGSAIEVGYAASNAHPYTPIGRIVSERADIPAARVTMSTIKAYLREHPEERDEILHANRRYIFFRQISDGPVGSLGVPLTELRSLAADPRVYPPGALVFLRSELPSRLGLDLAPSRVAVLQDSGSAVVGPGRLDLFVGTGDVAGSLAGGLRAPSELYFLLPPE